MTQNEKRDLLIRFGYIDTPEIRFKYGLRDIVYKYYSNLQKKTWDKIQKAVDEIVLDEEVHRKALLKDILDYREAVHCRLDILQDEIRPSYPRTLEDLQEIWNHLINTDIDVNIDDYERR